MTPPQCLFTFQKRSPELGSQPCVESNCSALSTSSRCHTIASGPAQPTPDGSALDPSHSSARKTPLSAPENRSPPSCPLGSDDADLQPKATFLQDFAIPSPLLYHRKSWEDIFGADKGKGGPSNDEFLLPCGQERLDPDLSSKNFKLVSPLQPPYDGLAAQNSPTGRPNARHDTEISVLHDPPFCQRTCTYLTSSPNRNGRCPRPVTPPVEDSILARTTILQKRQTHVYPGEYGLTLPSTPPSSARSTARPLAGRIEQACSAAAAIVSRYEPRACDNGTESNVDLHLPPLRLYEDPSSSPSVDMVDTELDRREGSAKLFPRSACNQDVGLERKGSCGALLEPERTTQDEKTTHSCKARSQFHSQSMQKRERELHMANYNSDSSSDVNADTSALDVSERSKLIEETDGSHIRGYHAEGMKTFKTLAPRSPLPATKPCPLHPVSQPLAAPSPHSKPSTTPSSPHVAFSRVPHLDVVEMRACPTTACTALLLLAPTSRKLDLDRVNLRNKRPEQENSGRIVEQPGVRFWETAIEAGFVIMASVGGGVGADISGGDGDDADGSSGLDRGAQSKKSPSLSSPEHKQDHGQRNREALKKAVKVADDLGFEARHREDCTFGRKYHHSKGDKETATDAGMGSGASGLEQEGEKVKVEIEDGDGDGWGMDSEDDWVGEGAGLEFWGLTSA